MQGAKRYGVDFNREKFIATNERIVQRQKKIDEINKRKNYSYSRGDLKEIKLLIEEPRYKMSCIGN